MNEFFHTVPNIVVFFRLLDQKFIANSENMP